jgi:S1-C subfamily serine protease
MTNELARPAIVGLAVALSSILLTSGCTGENASQSATSSSANEATATPKAVPTNAEDAASHTSPIFLIVAKTDGGDIVSGTCFYLARPDGRWLITANHVIRDAQPDSIIVRVGQTSIPLKIFAQDRATDLAALTPSRSIGYAPLTLRDTSPQSGEMVSFSGFPIPDVMGVNIATTVQGAVTNATSTVGGMADFKIDAPTTGGDSGAPVLDAQRAVVGIVVYSADNRQAAYAVDGLNVIKLLQGVRQ